MSEEEKNNQNSEESEVIEVIEVAPVESPSENYLVTEQLQRMPSIFSRGLLYLVLLLLVVALAYSVIGEIDMVVESKSVARPESHKIKVLSDRTGYIEKIFIAEGQLVEKGAPLFFIRSKETLTYETKVEELRQLIPLKKIFYETKKSSIHEELRQLENDHRSTLKEKKIKLEQNAISLASTESDMAYWKKEVESLSKEFDDTERLFEKNLTSIAEYNNIKSRLERAKTEVEMLLSKKEINSKENKIIEGEIERLKLDYGSRKSILEKQLRNIEIEQETTVRSLQSELKMNLGKLAIKDTSSPTDTGETGNIIHAEKSGTVSELYFRNAGEYVRDADLLCTILPMNSPLYMDIIVANKDVGFIEEGMTIKYRFDAFPYTDYGTLRGKVIAVSPSAVEDSTLGFVYNVRGSLDETLFIIKEKYYPVKAGMTATAELVTDRKSIFSILFKKLKE